MATREVKQKVMFPEESKWLGEKIQGLAEKGSSRLLNVGSSTGYFRKVIAPHIEENIFKPLETTGVQIVHSDIKDGDGIDLVGNLYDVNFLERLRSDRYDIVLCSNLLEHLENRQAICDILAEVVQPEGHLIVTVPYRYPYHLDPIDTMYRPSISELADAFPGTVLVEGEIINDTRTYADKLIKDKRLAMIIFARSFLPFYKPKVWWNTVSYLPNMFKEFQVTCVILQKVI